MPSEIMRMTCMRGCPPKRVPSESSQVTKYAAPSRSTSPPATTRQCLGLARGCSLAFATSVDVGIRTATWADPCIVAEAPGSRLLGVRPRFSSSVVEGGYG